jgi:hypothetical protein
LGIYRLAHGADGRTLVKTVKVPRRGISQEQAVAAIGQSDAFRATG